MGGVTESWEWELDSDYWLPSWDRGEGCGERGERQNNIRSAQRAGVGAGGLVEEPRDGGSLWGWRQGPTQEYWGPVEIAF